MVALTSAFMRIPVEWKEVSGGLPIPRPIPRPMSLTHTPLQRMGHLGRVSDPPKSAHGHICMCNYVS